MSLDLTLAVEEWPSFGRKFLAYNRVSVGFQDYKVFHKIRDDAETLPEEVLWYDDEGLQTTREDKYGVALTFITAGKLAKHLQYTKQLGRGGATAVAAYIAALPPETRVLLWWH